MKKYSLIALMFLATLVFSQDVYRLNDSTFVYPCLSDSVKALNFVGLPLETNFINASDFDPDGVNIDAVSRWNAEAQAWETAGYHPALGWGTDFTVETGGAYMINALNNFDFTVTGEPADVVYDLLFNEDLWDFNMIVQPLTKPELTTSAELGDDIVNCYQVIKYDNSSQTWNISDRDPFFGGWLFAFPTEVGTPLMVNMTSDTTWPSEKVSYSESLSNENKVSKVNSGGPRVVYFHIQDGVGNEFDFPREAELIKPFKVWMPKRPLDVLTPEDFGCGYAMINGLSVAYINLGNFDDPWSEGEELNFRIDWSENDYVKELKYFEISYNYTLDNVNSPVFLGFEPFIAGSGEPQLLHWSMYVKPLSSPPYITFTDSISGTLNWNASPFMCYIIYSSDNPYSAFNYIEGFAEMGVSSIWIPLDRDKRFYQIIVIGAWDYPWYKEDK